MLFFFKMLLIAVVFSITAAYSIPPRLAIDDKLGRTSHNASSHKHWNHNAHWDQHPHWNQHPHCPVKQFWTPNFPKPQDWVDNNIDGWLDTWFTINSKKNQRPGIRQGMGSMGTRNS